MIDKNTQGVRKIGRSQMKTQRRAVLLVDKSLDQEQDFITYYIFTKTTFRCFQTTLSLLSGIH
jgi:hypothetical protein